jgi:hypothetical protein
LTAGEKEKTAIEMEIRRRDKQRGGDGNSKKKQTQRERRSKVKDTIERERSTCCVFRFGNLGSMIFIHSILLFFLIIINYL